MRPNGHALYSTLDGAPGAGARCEVADLSPGLDFVVPICAPPVEHFIARFEPRPKQSRALYSLAASIPPRVLLPLQLPH